MLVTSDLNIFEKQNIFLIIKFILYTMEFSEKQTTLLNEKYIYSKSL